MSVILGSDHVNLNGIRLYKSGSNIAVYNNDASSFLGTLKVNPFTSIKTQAIEVRVTAYNNVTEYTLTWTNPADTVSVYGDTTITHGSTYVKYYPSLSSVVVHGNTGGYGTASLEFKGTAYYLS